MKIKTILFAACLLPAVVITPPLSAQNFTFTTIAGGASGFLDGANSSAQFRNVTGVAADGAGNVYVADRGNNAIREITPLGTNWIVTTIAGGTQGSLDGTNTGAQFFGPAGIAVDSSGKLYVTDQFNNTIRQITPVGANWVVTTIAGGAGLSGNLDGTNLNARFSDPAGIAVDGSGNVFIADEANNSIRKITPSGTNWIVTTIAGGSSGNSDGTNDSARFSSPSGVAVDAAGRVFVADQFNNTIRLITPVDTNWVVTTIAGGSVAGRSDGTGTNARFNSPQDVAVDNNDNVYVTDLFNSAIREMMLVGTNWTVTTIAGGTTGSADGTGTNAQFNLPFGAAADSFGDVFVADYQNNAIRLGAAAGSPPPVGGLQVTITPSSAVSAGAAWQLDGGPFQTSGALLSGLTPGDHAISFTNVAGFTTPPEQTIPVTAHQTLQVAGNYTAAIANAGSLQVIFSPMGVLKAGPQWRVDFGASLQTNAAIVAGLSAGTHTVSCTGLPGWTTPTNQTVTITNGQTTVAQAIYVLQSGSLQVTILPAAVVSAGAQWRVDGGTLQASGTTLSGLSPGSHTVGFNTVLGWQTPSNQVVTITNSLTSAMTATYTQAGSLQVTLLPASAVSAGAQWQVDGSPWQTNGAVVSGLLTGNHNIAFSAVGGWSAPSNQTATITANQTATATATYIVLPQLSGMAVAGGEFQFALGGSAGSNYVIQTSADLLTWTPLSTNTVPGSGSILINDPGVANHGSRFYRAVLP